ncbi:programmed cell death protein 2, partial [Nilaparvata lugens]|uniref:programmed cell death protein 2 n=1 Tax=Nilaparvata lugens TaxID=108931 RepID=UPI00193DE94C
YVFPFEAPEVKESWGKEITAHKFGVKLCQVCGLKSLKNCSVCKETSYCTKEHQIYDWKAGHKKTCNNRAVILNSQVSFLFPEYEVQIESENCDDSDELNDSDEKILETVGEGSLSGVACDEELSKMALADEDKLFTKFQKRIKSQSDQVIRYERCGDPLWVTSQNIPAMEEVPNCQYCGGKRVFEFQIMPQLLCFLKADTIPGCESLDWGTVAIFTCESSCGSDQSQNAYKQEFALKQDYTV